MTYTIRFGEPEVIAYFKKMVTAKKEGTIHKNDAKLFKKVLKTVSLLQTNPKHPSLATHEIEELSKKVGFKVFEAYVENKTPRAARLFWVYGPNKHDITIIGIEPHPEDKNGAYKRIKLSQLPKIE